MTNFLRARVKKKIIVARSHKQALECMIDLDLGLDVHVVTKPEHVDGFRLGDNDTVWWYSDPKEADEVRERLLWAWA